MLDTPPPKIVFLQELWVPYAHGNEMDKLFQEYSILISTPEDLLCNAEHIWHGSAIMWHCSMAQHVTSLKTNNDRITLIKINYNNLSLLAVSVYCPTSGKDIEFLDCISDLSNLIIENKTENEYLLLGLDSNCSEKSSVRRVKALESFCQEFDLVKISTNHATFHHHNGTSQSNIDYFLISRELSSSFSSASFSCSLNTPENLSSHDPVYVTMVLPKPDMKKEESLPPADLHFQISAWVKFQIHAFFLNFSASPARLLDTFFMSA